MERYEKAFLAACAVILVIFLCALGYGSVAMGVPLPSRGGLIYCGVGEKLRQVLSNTPPSDHPSSDELVNFLCALGYGSVAMGVHLPSRGGLIYCGVGEKLRKVLSKTPPFDHTRSEE